MSVSKQIYHHFRVAISHYSATAGRYAPEGGEVKISAPLWAQLVEEMGGEEHARTAMNYPVVVLDDVSSNFVEVRLW